MIEDEIVLKIAAHVLTESRRGSLSTQVLVDEILKPASLREWKRMGCDLSDETDRYDLANRISGALGRHVRSVPERQRIVSGSKRAWKAGPRAPALTRKAMAPATTQFTGLVGEYAVMSELLACGWNATTMAMDDGVDVIATKDKDHMRTVQVKCSHAFAHDPERFRFSIDRNAHDRYAGISYYYVLVMRYRIPGRWLNDMLLLSMSVFNDLRDKGGITSDQKYWTLTVELRGDRFLVGGREDFDVTSLVNTLDRQFV